MAEEYKDKSWNFLEVSKNYIKGDVISLHQILVKFLTELRSEFPINPLRNLSIPGIAFKIWKTKQLPLLLKDDLKIYDLSRTLDNLFRGAYLGGIVDVYRPHLIGQTGYYYDINSLYPTAMCKPMPVGIPTFKNLTNLDSSFFGFLRATVKAPALNTPGGYIGLLSIRVGGRLICPGGVFSGFFFSEELRFALANGYKLIEITEAYSFQRGVNTFLDLIQELNQMKVTAQLNDQPTLRNIAKLLMNSMYGRFGMHTEPVKDEIVTLRERRNYSIGF